MLCERELCSAESSDSSPTTHWRHHRWPSAAAPIYSTVDRLPSRISMKATASSYSPMYCITSRSCTAEVAVSAHRCSTDAREGMQAAFVPAIVGHCFDLRTSRVDGLC